MSMITVSELKPFDSNFFTPTILVGTPTHGKGERMGVLKRNLLNLNHQQSTNWGQVIMIDHSPESVAKEIVAMVQELPNSDRRAVYWMHGQKPTGLWGKISHQHILELCHSPYYSFHSDDNFMAHNHLSTLVKLLNEHDELSFVCSNCYRCNPMRTLLMHGFDSGATDLGCPLFKVDPCFGKTLPDLKVLPNVYAWDWEMLEVLTKAGLKFSCTGLATYIWTQMQGCNQEALEQPAMEVDYEQFGEIKAKYPNFKVYEE